MSRSTRIICDFTVNRNHINKKLEARVVAYTNRYSSGPLIPNLPTAAVLNLGINCPIEYVQVSATILVSLLLFSTYITNFPYTWFF